MPEFTQTKFQIDTVRKEAGKIERQKIDVDGYTLESFGVHEETLDDAAYLVVVVVFPITHLPTGLAACWADSLESGQEIIRHLLSTGVDWANFNDLDYCEKVKISKRVQTEFLPLYQQNGWLHAEDAALRRTRRSPADTKELREIAP